MATLVLKLAGMVRNLSEKEHDVIFACSFNGIEIRPLHEDGGAPMPWDADFHISGGPKGDMFNLHGGVGPGGFGECKLALPLKNVDDYYRFELTTNPGKERAVYALLRSVGIRFQDEGKAGETASEASLTQAYWNSSQLYTGKGFWVQEADLDEACYLELDEAIYLIKNHGAELTPEDESEGSIGLQYSQPKRRWMIVRTSIIA